MQNLRAVCTIPDPQTLSSEENPLPYPSPVISSAFLSLQASSLQTASAGDAKRKQFSYNILNSLTKIAYLRL